MSTRGRINSFPLFNPPQKVKLNLKSRRFQNEKMTSAQTILLLICWMSGMVTARDLTTRDSLTLTDLDDTHGLVDSSKEPLSRDKRYIAQQYQNKKSRFRSVAALNIFLRNVPAYKRVKGLRSRRNLRYKVCF